MGRRGGSHPPSPRRQGPVEVVLRAAGAATHGPASRRLLLALRRATRRPASGVTLLLTSDREIRALNRRHLGHDRVTDVLSFPSDPPPFGRRTWSAFEAPHLGDIAVSLPRARRQARRAGWPLRSEMALLLTHGYLHLLGHDHEIDDGTMHRLEARLLERVAGVRLDRRRLPWGDSTGARHAFEGAGRRPRGPRFRR